MSESESSQTPLSFKSTGDSVVRQQSVYPTWRIGRDYLLV